MRFSLRSSLVLLFVGLMAFASFGFGMPQKEPKGPIVGWIVLDEKDSICLVEATDVEGFPTGIGGITLIADGISAYYVRDGVFTPAHIFPDHQATIKYMPSDEPLNTSNPYSDYCAFDPMEWKLYLAISERTSLGGWGCFDRYLVYQFDGHYFVCLGEDGDFWLHPSIRQFGRLFYMGKAKDYLVRVDEVRSYDIRGIDPYEYEAEQIDTCRYRYSAWKHKDNMREEPDLVIYNGWFDDESGGYVFENNGYKYVVGGDLRVYHDNRLILKQELQDLIDSY